MLSTHSNNGTDGTPDVRYEIVLRWEFCLEIDIAVVQDAGITCRRESDDMWYVIQTMKGKEKKIADEVRNGIAKDDENVFVFENEMEYRVNGQWIKDAKPFFPGYIFVDMKAEKALDFDFRLRKEKYPLRLLRIDDVVTPLRPEEEEYLTRLGGEERTIRSSEGFRVDDMVEITSGSFKGWKGEIKKLNRHKRRATICVPMMGREVEVNIGLEIVKYVSWDELGANELSDIQNISRIVTA